MIGLIRNIRVSRKIIGAFALLLSCTIGLGLFTVARLDTLNSAAGEIGDHWLPATRTLGDLSYFTMRFRQLEAAHILAPADAKPAEAKTLGMVRAQIDKAFADYLPLARSEKQRQLLDTMKQLWADYVTGDGKLQTLSQNMDAVNATALYRGDLRTLFHHFQDVLKENIDEDVGSGNRAAQWANGVGSSSKVSIAATIGVVAILCIIIGYMLINSISGPVTEMTRAMLRLAEGDNAVAISATNRKDEIGQMAGALQLFKEAAIERLKLVEDAERAREAAQAERSRNDAAQAELTRQRDQAQVVQSIAAGLQHLAGGDLMFRLHERFAPEYEELRDHFNGALGKLEEAMSTISANTNDIHIGTNELSSASDDMSRRTEQQAATLEETAAALDEITSTVRRTADGAEHAKAAVGNAKAIAEQSGDVVRLTTTAMSEIEFSAKRIIQIIGVVDEIAFQTNLLALNAGVEAARAGDAGRGFAVVASEVRALAQRAADAAKEIKGLIMASTAQVEKGVDLVARTGEALGKIITQVAEINEIVVEIASSTTTQASGLHQINAAMNQMDQATQQHAAMVEEATGTSVPSSPLLKVTPPHSGTFTLWACGATMRNRVRRSEFTWGYCLPD